MQFLLIPIGSAGDVFPYIGLAVALRQRGKDVAILANEYFAAPIERAGIPCEIISTAEDYLRVAEDPRIWHPFHGPQVVFSFAVNLIQPVYDAIRKSADASDSVLVSSCLGWGARLAQERDGYRLATLDLQPATLFSAVDPPRLLGLSHRAPAWWNRMVFRLGERLCLDPVACPAINEQLRQSGLPAMHRITDWWHSPQCILGMFPSWYAQPQPDWPRPLQLTEFPLWDDGGQGALPDEVESFLSQGDPPIVVTPGSANPCSRPFWQAVIQASQRLGRRALLLARFGQAIPHPLPPGVRHFEYASFAQLLPRAAALVHHGGIGTTARALAAGLPQVIQPFSHDQPDNAYRVGQLGVGATIPRRRFTAARLAQELHRLLTDPQVAARCRAIADRFSGIDPFAESCLALEQLAMRNA